jgi:ABC-type transporter Mla subunit MlaD
MHFGKYESSGAGTAVAFLFSGKQIRKDLRRSYEDTLDTISDWTDEAKDRFEEAIEKGADFTEELRAKAEPLGQLLRRS